MKTIDDLIGIIEAEHEVEPAGADAAERIGRFELRAGFALPDDVRTFYVRCRGAEIGDSYRLMGLEEWVRTGEALQGEEWADSEPRSFYAFCDVFDGNYVGIDLVKSPDGHNRVLDCDHEDVRSRRVIARTFTEFLDRALAYRNGLYYLSGAHEAFETIELPYRPPVSWLRRQYEKWSSDPEIGPETCKQPGCTRLRVHLSVHCRPHHFEEVHGLPYPFDD